ncbi:unnamed protein product [marine sediment metagenome]|uniref:DUF3795 domain-containing protein n=1 Tax=marine sediment metagenome TaxID=412755 RepID=X1NEP4_9ZZZZ
MPSACGIACEVCGIQEKGICPFGDGCVAGTDPRAPEKSEKFKAATGHTCPILECAIKNRVDHCLRCDEFPCEVHYQQGGPFSKKTLDMLKGVLGKK